MKTLLIALTVLFASVAHAEVITPKQLDELYEKNRATYMTLTPGMTVEYHQAFIDKDEQGNTEECFSHVKEVLVSEESIYSMLVYYKETALEDCNGSKKGDVSERLMWFDVNQLDGDQNKDIEYTKIEVTGNIVRVEGINSKHEQTRKFKSVRDLSKSQFYSLSEIKFENSYSYKLIKRSMTDLSTLKLDNLETSDFTTIK